MRKKFVRYIIFNVCGKGLIVLICSEFFEINEKNKYSLIEKLVKDINR